MYRILLSATPERISQETSRLIKWLDQDIFPLDVRQPVAGAYCWVAYSDMTPVGFGALEITGKKAVLTRAGIMAKHRGNGLYKKIIQKMTVVAKRSGCRTIDTYTKAFNVASINGLIASGFRAHLPDPMNLENINYWRKRL
jgi:hypothetical protein